MALDAEIARIWATADRDGSGTIDAAEIATLMAALAGGAQPTLPEVQSVMAQLDSDRDGTVSFAEFQVGERAGGGLFARPTCLLTRTQVVMRHWLAASHPEAGGDDAITGSADAHAAVADGNVVTAVMAMDAGESRDGFTSPGRATAMPASESRRAIAAFFAEFTQETLTAAAAASVKDAVRKEAAAVDATAASWPLLYGPFGVFTRASPYAKVASGHWDDITADDRLTALSHANATCTALGDTATQLTSPGSVSTWMPLIQAVSAHVAGLSYPAATVAVSRCGCADPAHAGGR